MHIFADNSGVVTTAPLFFIVRNEFIMKKIIGIIAASIMVLAALTGCGNNASQDAGSMASNAVSNVESGANQIAGNSGSASEGNTSGNAQNSGNEQSSNNGSVTDNNGIIGDNDETNPSDNGETNPSDVLI